MRNRPYPVLTQGLRFFAPSHYQKFLCIRASACHFCRAPARLNCARKVYQQMNKANKRTSKNNWFIQQAEACDLELDEMILDALFNGYIRLLRVSWLVEQPADYRIERRQQLDALAALRVPAS